MSDHLDVVFLDVGGTIYDDVWYARALLRALRDLGAEVTDDQFTTEYDRWRADPAGSFRLLLARRFLGEGFDLGKLGQAMARYWSYPADALLPGVRESLDTLSGTYRFGIIADQERTIRDALRRDGIEPYIELWCVSAEIGAEKPDPKVFELALQMAEVDAGRAVMVGDRLDDDIRPAGTAGMRTVWVLTGKAPANPTEEQLAEPEVAIRSLAELPGALGRLQESDR